jgi:hypothetical protein
MVLSNAERQARWRKKRNSLAKQAEKGAAREDRRLEHAHKRIAELEAELAVYRKRRAPK